MKRMLLLLVAWLLATPAFAQVPGPIPALPDTQRLTQYTVNTGSKCTCAVNFQIYGDGSDVDNWIEVFWNGTRVLSTDPIFGWVLSSPSGPLTNIPRPITNAIVTFNNAAATDFNSVVIVGARRPRRLTQFNENQGVAARDLNQVLTDIIAQNRETWDKINDVTGRGIFSQPGNTMKLLPQPSLCINQLLSFGPDGLTPTCVVGGGGGGGGAVSSVANSDGTLAISPTTGAVIASLALGHANTWTNTQSFLHIIDQDLISGGTQCVQATAGGQLSGTGSSCATSVNSVANSDGTLTISPTTGIVVASLALGHANSWTNTQTFLHIIDQDLVSAGAQCVQATAGGQLTGTGATCGTGGGGGGVSSVTAGNTSLTISPTSGAVVATLNVANSNTWSSTQTFSVGTNLGAQTVSNWINDVPPANITRVYDRLFVGGAAVSTGQKPPTVGSDWLGAYQNSIGSYLQSGAPGFGVIVAETSVSNANSIMGVVAGARTANMPAATTGDTALALAGFGLSNNSSLGSGSGAWGVYTECHREATGNGSICVAAEFEPRNNATGERQADPYTPGFTVGVGLGCGAGVASTGKPCGEAMTVLANPQPFNAGITFQPGSITAQSLFGGTVSEAIGLPLNYGILWYSAANNAIAGIDTNGANSLILSSKLSIGLLAPVFTNSTSSWWLNDTPPVNSISIGDKLLIGDAARNYPDTSGCATGDWFTNFQATTSNGACAYIGMFATVVESNLANIQNFGGAMFAGQTKNCGVSGCGSIGLMGFELQNNPNVSGANASYAIYGECDKTQNNTGGCLGIEVDEANFTNTANQPDPFQQGLIVGIQDACGSGLTSPTVFHCDAAMQIVPNNQPFNVGISFLTNSIAGQSMFGGTVPVAVAMPLGYAFVWYSAAGTAVGGIQIDGFGNVNIVSTGCLKYNGSCITVP